MANLVPSALSEPLKAFRRHPLPTMGAGAALGYLLLGGAMGALWGTGAGAIAVGAGQLLRRRDDGDGSDDGSSDGSDGSYDDSGISDASAQLDDGSGGYYDDGSGGGGYADASPVYYDDSGDGGGYADDGSGDGGGGSSDGGGGGSQGGGSGSGSSGGGGDSGGSGSGQGQQGQMPFPPYPYGAVPPAAIANLAHPADGGSPDGSGGGVGTVPAPGSTAAPTGTSTAPLPVSGAPGVPLAGTPGTLGPQVDPVTGQIVGQTLQTPATTGLVSQAMAAGGPSKGTNFMLSMLRPGATATTAGHGIKHVGHAAPAPKAIPMPHLGTRSHPPAPPKKPAPIPMPHLGTRGGSAKKPAPKAAPHVTPRRGK